MARRVGGARDVDLMRRALILKGGAALCGLPFAGAAITSNFSLFKGFQSSPFVMGVASGDPTSDGVVLWTRLAMPQSDPADSAHARINVGWELAADDRFTKIVKRGAATASAEWGHAIHVEVSGLEPDRWYWYRFHAGNADSPRAGRARCRGPARAPIACGSRSVPASTSNRGCSPRTGTWPPKISTWSFTWATTSTKDRARPIASGCTKAPSS